MTADRTARSTEAQHLSRLDVTCCLGCRALTLCLSMRTLCSAQPFRPIWRNSGGEEVERKLGRGTRKGDCSEVLIDCLFPGLGSHGYQDIVPSIMARSISEPSLQQRQFQYIVFLHQRTIKYTPVFLAFFTKLNGAASPKNPT